mgnify:CR=1 FL=1
MNLAPSTQSQHPFSGTKSHSWGTIFEIGILIIVGVLFYVYLLGPKLKESNERHSKLDSLTTQYDNLESQGKTFEELQAKIRDNPDKVTLLDATLPLQSHLTQLYILLEDLAGRASIVGPSISVQPEKAVATAGDKSVEETPFAQDRKTAIIPAVVSGTGTVDQIDGFLHLLEINARVFDVTDIDITQGKDDQLIFKVALQSYVYAPQEVKADAAGLPLPTEVKP